MYKGLNGLICGAIPPIERIVVMDKFDVVFVVVVAAFIAVVEVVIVVEAVTSPKVVIVGGDETVNEID